MTYQDAIAEPWNGFLTRAEDLSIEDALISMDTDEEVIRFVAENTFLDGESLNAVFPMIEEFLVEYRAQGEDDLDKIFNFDDFRITPRNLKGGGGGGGGSSSGSSSTMTGGYWDEEGVYHPNEAMLTDSDWEGDWAEDNQRDS